MVRASDEATFDAVGLTGWPFGHENPAQPATLDEDGNVVHGGCGGFWGACAVSKGNTVTRIGPHVITPAVLDDDGNTGNPSGYWTIASTLTSG